MGSKKSYILYSFLLFGLLIVMSYLDYRLEIFVKYNFAFYDLWKWAIFKPLFYIPVGVVLAIPIFIKNMKGNGVWKIDKIRLVFLGIPAFLLAFYPPIHFYTPLKDFSFTILFIVSGSELYILSGAILGYVVLSSFCKVDHGMKKY